MVDFAQKNIKVYVNVYEDGSIMDAEIGENIVRIEPADFFFIVNDDYFAENNTTEEEFKETIRYYKVVLNGFKAELVKGEIPVIEEPATEEPPVEEPAEEPPVETEPTN